MRTWAEIRRDLIAAHRKKDWDKAAELSQEKQEWQRKQRRTCSMCGVVLSNPKSRNCALHYRFNRYYRKSMASVVQG